MPEFMFKKFFQKNKNGKDLTLGEHNSIWTKFCFLDESGSLSNPTDPFFYEDISIRVLGSAIPENEILIVIADYIATPKNIRFEVNIKRKLNEKFNRLAVAGVCRFDSKSNDLLQIADLIVGAINYDIKLSTGVSIRGDKYKLEFLDYLKNNLGISTFIGGFRSRIFNIFVDKDVKQRLPLLHNEQGDIKEDIKKEKGPSS